MESDRLVVEKDLESNRQNSLVAHQKHLIILENNYPFADSKRSNGEASKHTSCNLTWLALSIIGVLSVGIATVAVSKNQFSFNKVNTFSSSSTVSTSNSSSTIARTSVSSSSQRSEAFQTELSNIASFITDDVPILTTTMDDDNITDTNDTPAIIVDAQSKPNIIFLLADDLGFNSMGDQDLDLDFATPFLSKLARKGIIMSNYYTQESCTPARAALLTGRYPLSIGMQLASINSYQSRGLPLGETLLPQVLKEKAGYTTYMIGKWNLGHYSPKYLPSARGFDYFLGFMDGQSYYWSKKNPKYTKFTDLMYGDSTCYGGYDGSDRHDYSTFLYRDKAINTINTHDYDTSPMFMYLAFQAVHDPFYDFQQFESGVPKHYLSSSIYNEIVEGVVGRKRRQYAMALALMDSAVESIYHALKQQDQLDNSYIIFSSDNGGCYSAGGKNGEYRGTKGSLYEGGTKVDAFLYSKGLIGKAYAGTKFNGLMHVTDWMPTILDMVGVGDDYEPTASYSFDGVSQWNYFLTSSGDESAREYMLYNYIGNINGSEHSFDILTNAPAAVRNKEGFKLIHAFVGNPSSMWYSYNEVSDDDSNLHDSAQCTQSDSMSDSGTYTYMLYDLSKDPYETTNLYEQEEYFQIKNTLYTKLALYYTNSASCTADSEFKVNKNQKSVWLSAGGFIVPWATLSEADMQHTSYPILCDANSSSSDSPLSPLYDEHDDVGEGDDEEYTHRPSADPTFAPTMPPTVAEVVGPEPSHKPSHKPTHKPTHSPDYTKPTNHPTVTGYTHKPTHSPDYVKPTNHPTVTGYTHKPTHSPDYVKPTNHPTATGYTHKPTHQPTQPSPSPSLDSASVDTPVDILDPQVITFAPSPTQLAVTPSAVPPDVADLTHAPSPTTYVAPP